MSESSYDYLKSRDAAEKENRPWLDFSYAETVTPETIFDKIKKATHKLNIKGVLETITSNSKSKLNSQKDIGTNEQEVISSPLTVATIETATGKEMEKDTEQSKE